MANPIAESIRSFLVRIIDTVAGVFSRDFFGSVKKESEEASGKVFGKKG